MQVLDGEAVASIIFPMMRNFNMTWSLRELASRILLEFFFFHHPTGCVSFLEHALHCGSRFQHYLDDFGACAIWCTWWGPYVKPRCRLHSLAAKKPYQNLHVLALEQIPSLTDAADASSRKTLQLAKDTICDGMKLDKNF
jgi:hypothetical protein